MKLHLPTPFVVGTAMLLGASAALAAHHVPKASAPSASQALPAAPKAAVKPVDINNASLAELKTLPGVGDAEAERIVKGRPYLSKANAFNNNVLPESAYESLKGRIVVKEPKDPRAKAAVRQATAKSKKPVAKHP